MQRLLSSTDVLADTPALHERLTRDGYLFFPGLLDPRTVQSLNMRILETVAGYGWTADGTDPHEAVPASPERYHYMENSGEVEHGWRPGYIAIQRLEAFHRLAFEPALLSLTRSLLGPDVLVHGQRIARVIWPAQRITTLPHQDYTFMQGTPDTLTTWIPLSDCPAALGGLKILPASHTAGLRPMTSADGVAGTGSQRCDVDDDDPAWATADWKAGDVVLFHSLTVHAGQPNTAQRLRLSVDFRYQSKTSPIALPSLLPHNCPYTPDWEELLATTRWSGYETVADVRDPSGYQLVEFKHATDLETFADELTPLPASRFVA